MRMCTPVREVVMAEMTYLQAIRAALWEEMEADERVFLLGEDIGVYGGVYKVTEGFLSTPYDAKGLLKAAIRDPNPVVYLEQKYLYRRLRQHLPAEDYIVPLGTADVKWAGSDVSVICYGSMVQMALTAADTLAGEDIDVEVVDLRSLVPLDEDAILESVRKTSKAVVIQEAPQTAGFGAEIAARIAQKAFEWLDGPVVRVTAPDTPIPTHPTLEQEYLPNAEKIADAVRSLAAY